MKNYLFFKIVLLCSLMTFSYSCQEDFLDVPIGAADLEIEFYKTDADFFQALVATYDVTQWGSTKGLWTMSVGLLNAASDDTHAGGSDASDQPSWVAYDQFTLDPFLGPQEGLWAKYFTGIFRANLILNRIDNAPDVTAAFRARTIAEAKFLRAFFYFDLARFFGNVPLITTELSPDEITSITQSPVSEIYAQVERDLNDAINEPLLPEITGLQPSELGRITRGAAQAMLGKAILYQNDDSRMIEAAGLFESVINGGNYGLLNEFGDIFEQNNEFSIESVYEIVHSENRPGDWGCCFAAGPTQNPTEGNFSVQFFGMRDFTGDFFASGWSFCPVSQELVDFMNGDPRFAHTIIDGNALKQQGANYTEGFQNTDFFIRKYAPLIENQPNDGIIPLGWGSNIREIRYADVLLMAAEALVRGGGDNATARAYVNQVRQRVSLQPFPGSVNGTALLDAIYRERRMELATEGHRFFDLVRTGQAAQFLPGFQTGVHELLPIPQREIDITEGRLIQNPGY